MIVIVMGVAGSGKTTIGQALSEKLNWPFEDGDWWHPAENKDKMRKGVPLTDDDRIPWLCALHQLCFSWLEDGKSGILACSALKRKYRDILLNGYPATEHNNKEISTISENYIFVVLHGSPGLLNERISARSGHFMAPSLLDSQLSALELPGSGEYHIMCSIDKSADETVRDVVTFLDL